MDAAQIASAARQVGDAYLRDASLNYLDTNSRALASVVGQGWMRFASVVEQQNRSERCD